MYDIISHFQQWMKVVDDRSRPSGDVAEPYNAILRREPFRAVQACRRAQVLAGDTYRGNIDRRRPAGRRLLETRQCSRALDQRLCPGRSKSLPQIGRQSSFSISLESASGFVTEPNRVITLPSLSTRNFVKFHLMPSVPNTPGASSVR